MIKKVLLTVAIILVTIGVYVARDMLWDIAKFLYGHPVVFVAVIAAVLIQFVGHALRAKRTKLVLDQAAKSSLQFQFVALSTGYLFNILLPFRLGEAIRALLIAKRLHISLMYTFAAIVIERATDVLFLSVIIIISALALQGTLSMDIFLIATIAGIGATGLLYMFVLLKNENKYLLHGVVWVSQLFRTSISTQLRFKVWSLIFGLQSFTSNRRLERQYAGFAALSWFCYFSSTLILTLALLSVDGFLQAAVASVSPYVIPVRPFDASTYHQLVSLLPLNNEGHNFDVYAKLLWVVLALPMAVTGLIGLALYRPGSTQSASRVKENPYVNILLRHKDISQEFPAFLDSYFSGNNLARILHKIEVSGQLSLVKFFKGGSDAITSLVFSNGELFVKKIIPIEYRDRLKAQYDWLDKHKTMRYLVKVMDEQDADNYYAIDLAYDPNNIPLFEYIHYNSLEQSKLILSKTWGALYDHLHKEATPLKYRPKRRDQYIEKHIVGCINIALAESKTLKVLLVPDKIIINGEVYDNLYQILEKIKNHPQAWRDIATYRESKAVHGDPSVDNILVSQKNERPLIIDPAPDGNIINGPVFDMGKFMQSFYCGYEFLFRDEDPVEPSADGSINYREYRSEKYNLLCQYIQQDLAPKYLSESEQRAIMFHGGALLIRRLKHQIHYNPGNALKFYAVGVKTLNDFLAQYDD